MKNHKTSREIGNEGEDLAAAYLESKGYTILERNYYFQRAEVDIVAYDSNCIVFVEVKRRANRVYGSPEEYIDQAKINNIYKAADAWIHERKMRGAPVRFDVIAIVQKGSEAPDIRHYENAFMG